MSLILLHCISAKDQINFQKKMLHINGQFYPPQTNMHYMFDVYCSYPSISMYIVCLVQCCLWHVKNTNTSVTSLLGNCNMNVNVQVYYRDGSSRNMFESRVNQGFQWQVGLSRLIWEFNSSQNSRQNLKFLGQTPGNFFSELCILSLYSTGQPHMV